MGKDKSDMVLEVVRLFQKGKWKRKAAEVVRSKRRLRMVLALVALFIQQRSWGDFRRNMSLLYHYAKDIAQGNYREYHPAKLVMTVAVLLYVLSPLDLIPDFVVGLGLLDDAALVSYAVHLMGAELGLYQSWRRKTSAQSQDDDTGGVKYGRE